MEGGEEGGEGGGDALADLCGPLLASMLQGVPQHWTPENLAKSLALYKHELDT